MRHRHKKIELRLLRTVTLAFPNSLLLGFANLILVVFKGGGAGRVAYIYVHTLSIQNNSLTSYSQFTLNEKLNT